jgi:hypothetical protein
MMPPWINNVLTNVRTTIATSTSNYVSTDNRTFVVINPWIKITVSWWYQINSKSLRWIIWWQYRKEMRIVCVNPDSTQTILTYDSDILPQITATSTTTWTDSLWWSISATTTTTINIGTTENTTLSCDYYWYFEKDSYIQLQVRHNAPWPVQILWNQTNTEPKRARAKLRVKILNTVPILPITVGGSYGICGLLTTQGLRRIPPISLPASGSPKGVEPP